MAQRNDRPGALSETGHAQDRIRLTDLSANDYGPLQGLKENGDEAHSLTVEFGSTLAVVNLSSGI